MPSIGVESKSTQMSAAPPYDLKLRIPWLNLGHNLPIFTQQGNLMRGSPTQGT